jgi:hypothetical protein
MINRACKIAVSVDGSSAIGINTIGSQAGLTCHFTIKRDLKATANTCDLQIHNLNADHRLALQQAKSALVQVDAGYVGLTSTLFLGDLRTTYSQRQGPDWVTSLSAGDGEKAMRSARVNVALRKGSDVGTVLNALVKALGVGAGNLSSAVAKIQSLGLGGAFSMGTVLSGSAAREMSRILESVGLTWSVQNGVLQILGIAEALQDFAVVVDETHGMLGSPSVDKDGTVSFRMLIQPDVIPGRKAVVTAHELKGQYVLQECTYTGDTRGDDWYVDAKGKPF